MTQHRIQQIEDYEPLIGAEKVERIREKAEKFKGLRIANFNSTYYGGGVAEMLSSMTLLMNSLGLQTECRRLKKRFEFSRKETTASSPISERMRYARKRSN
jgi:trehalose synthase